jgi:hypothetical protein
MRQLTNLELIIRARVCRRSGTAGARNHSGTRSLPCGFGKHSPHSGAIGSRKRPGRLPWQYAVDRAGRRRTWDHEQIEQFIRNPDSQRNLGGPSFRCRFRCDRMLAAAVHVTIPNFNPVTVNQQTVFLKFVLACPLLGLALVPLAYGIRGSRTIRWLSLALFPLSRHGR